MLRFVPHQETVDAECNAVNMEHFITGYTGQEHQLREAMKGVLGREKYEYFFDKVIPPLTPQDRVANTATTSASSTSSARKMPSSSPRSA